MGLDEVKEQQAVIRNYVDVIAAVAATLEPGTEDITERQEKFAALIDRFEATEGPIRHGMATVMLSFLDGLFVGEQEYEGIRDHLDLERWFRLPKSHERRIQGHRHAGIRLVLEGATLVPALEPMRRIPVRSRWTTCCRIEWPVSRRAKPRRGTAARS